MLWDSDGGLSYLVTENYVMARRSTLDKSLRPFDLRLKHRSCTAVMKGKSELHEFTLSSLMTKESQLRVASRFLQSYYTQVGIYSSKGFYSEHILFGAS
jgi:hypothetical protein